MPSRKRQRREPTHEWQKIQQYTLWPEQEVYERLRPVILFGETYGSTLFVAAATLASIIQGLDVIERRWREKKEKQKQQSAQAQPSSASSTQLAVSSSHKTPGPDGEITGIRLVMEDGSHHSLKRWVSNPDELRAHIDAFSDPTSKVKPLQATFMKREGRSLVVNITEGGKDNPQINVMLGYLEAE